MSSLNLNKRELSWKYESLEAEGLVKSNDEWQNFIDYMNDMAQRYFEEEL